MINAPEKINKFFCMKEGERERGRATKNMSQWQKKKPKIRKRPKLPFALKCVSDRPSKRQIRANGKKFWPVSLSVYVHSSTNHTLWETKGQSDDSVTNDFLSTRFKLQRFKPLEYKTTEKQKQFSRHKFVKCWKIVKHLNHFARSTLTFCQITELTCPSA